MKLRPAAGFAKSSELKKRLMLLGGSLAVALLIGEVVLHLFFADALDPQDEKSLLYRYDEILGWAPVADRSSQVTVGRTISVQNNSLGFRDAEPVKSDKPGILFLGDSFLWGYDVQAPERFTEKLQAKHPEWAIHNLGVSGYGTDQESLLLQKYFEVFHPRVVMLIFSENDNEDNSVNALLGGYYKPYFTRIAGPNGAVLSLKGVPVPVSERAFYSEHPFLCHSYVVRLVAQICCRLVNPPRAKHPDPTPELLLAMEKYVNEHGATFAIGIEGPQPALRPFLTSCRIPWVDLALEPKLPYRYPNFGQHWTPEGHTVVCEKIDALLTGYSKAHPDFHPVKPATPEAIASALLQYHRDFALALYGIRHMEEAVMEYEQVLRMQPDSVGTLNDLAWIRATDPDVRLRDGAEAVRLAERAVALGGGKPEVLLNTLAAAYAEAGRFPEAVATADKAAKVAEQVGDKDFVQRSHAMSAIFLSRQPYRGQPLGNEADSKAGKP